MGIYQFRLLPKMADNLTNPCPKSLIMYKMADNVIHRGRVTCTTYLFVLARAGRVNCPDEEMETRIVQRGKGSGRADDHAGAAKVRIATYHQQSSGCELIHEPWSFLVALEIRGNRSQEQP